MFNERKIRNKAPSYTPCGDHLKVLRVGHCFPWARNVTLSQILDKLDEIYRVVYSREAIMQQFSTESQQAGRGAAVCACRIENLLQRAVEKGHVTAKAKNDMLRN